MYKTGKQSLENKACNNEKDRLINQSLIPFKAQTTLTLFIQPSKNYETVPHCAFFKPTYQES